MNENINLTKILKGCPKGTTLYSTIYDEVIFVRIDYVREYPIIVMLDDGRMREFTSNGKYSNEHSGECVLFPSKDQRDWSKFERFWDKPKVEKFDVKTLHPFDKVLARGDKDTDWFATFFSHIDDSSHWASCGYFICAQCIPYNEETKHLVGTSDDCSEYYKWWEE